MHVQQSSKQGKGILICISVCILHRHTHTPLFPCCFCFPCQANSVLYLSVHICNLRVDAGVNQGLDNIRSPIERSLQHMYTKAGVSVNEKGWGNVRARVRACVSVCVVREGGGMLLREVLFPCCTSHSHPCLKGVITDPQAHMAHAALGRAKQYMARRHTDTHRHTQTHKRTACKEERDDLGVAVASGEVQRAVVLCNSTGQLGLVLLHGHQKETRNSTTHA